MIIRLVVSHSAPVSATGADKRAQKLHHPHIVVIVNQESKPLAHFLLRLLTPGALCLTVHTVDLHQSDLITGKQQQKSFYLPLTLLCPLSVLLFGRVSSGFAR